VSVASAANVLGGGTVLDAQHTLSNHLAGVLKKFPKDPEQNQQNCWKGQN
jgi:hypothetical protein